MEGKNIAKNGLSRLILKKKLHFLKTCKMTEHHFNRTPYKPAGGLLAAENMEGVKLCDITVSTLTQTGNFRTCFLTIGKTGWK